MMPLMESLTTSTNSLEGYFGRVSNPASITQWTHTLCAPDLETAVGSPRRALHWVRESAGGDLTHTFSLRLTDTADSEDTASICVRMLAHVILDSIPDTSLQEVLDYLGNELAMHRPVLHHDPLPIRTRKGKITRRYERPTYSIEE